MMLVLFGIAVLWESRALPLGTLQRPGPRFLPVVLAGLLLVLALLVLAFGGRSPSLRALDWSQARHVAAILAACGFAALALERLGYRTTMAVMLAFLLGAVERSRPVSVVSIAVGFALVSYWVFRRLGVQLPEGPFGF
jgi:hypothetical protein